MRRRDGGCVFVSDIHDRHLRVVDQRLSGVGLHLFSCASLTGSFGTGATNFAWTPTSPTDSIDVANFFDWKVSGSGFETYTVDVTLAFSSPDASSTTGSGGGYYATLFGVVSKGSLIWDDVPSLTFAQGSTLDIEFDDIKFAAGLGNRISSGASFAGNTVIAPVPLPASVPLLGAGLLGLWAVGRRKKAAVAA